MSILPPDYLELARLQSKEYDLMYAMQKQGMLWELSEARRRAIEALKTIPVYKLKHTQARVTLFIAEMFADEYVRALESGWEAAFERMTKLAEEHAIEQIGHFEEDYAYEVRPINFLTVAHHELRESLIKQHKNSIKHWGNVVERRVRDIMKAATIDRMTYREMTLHLSKETENMEVWQALRIIRTEGSYAYNAAHHSTLYAARESGIADLKKTCIATFDNRTSADSIPVHEQIREIGEMFVDGYGREYMHPPGRPNDREREVAYLPEPSRIGLSNEQRWEMIKKRTERMKRRGKEIDAFHALVKAREEKIKARKSERKKEKRK